jgi:hypothetical protein
LTTAVYNAVLSKVGKGIDVVFTGILSVSHYVPEEEE